MRRVGNWKDVYDRMRQMQRVLNALSLNGRKTLMTDLAFCVPHNVFSYRTGRCSLGGRCRRLQVLDILLRMARDEARTRKRIDRRLRCA